MKKPSYKALVTGIIIVIVLAVLLLYFCPMEMSDLINEDYEIRITRTEVGVRDGEPYIDTKNYDDLTEEQRQDIMSLFQQYTYRRTPGTLFSDGSISGAINNYINIYAFENSELVRTIIISDTGGMSVDSIVYAVQEPSALIQDIISVIERSVKD